MFRILKQDITKLRDVEVIVNAANGIGVMGAGVAGGIARSGGELLKKSVKEACNQKGKPFDQGDIYISDSGLMKRLGIKKVYHAVVMKYPGGPTSFDIVNKLCRSVISLAMKNEVKSIAFPGLGTGIGRLDKRIVAANMTRILESYSDSIDVTLTDLDDAFIQYAREIRKCISEIEE